MTTPTRLTTPAEVAPWLATDRRWCAYAIADLEEPFWSQAHFWALAEPAPAILLHLSLPSWDAFFAHGDPTTIAAIVSGLPALPPQVNLMLREEALDCFRRWYDFGEVEAMLRQCVTPATFRPVASGAAEQLRDPDELAAFYAGRAPAYDPAQMTRGVYFGVRGEDGRLLAVAGTHAASARYQIGVVGNVLTEPAARGRGLGKQVVSAVVATLFSEFACTEVLLNVRADNVPAIQLYNALGYTTICPFVETIATRHSSPDLDHLTIKPVSPDEAPLVLALLQAAARWLLSQGINQWHPEYFTDVGESIAQGELFLAWDGTHPVGTFRLQWSDPEVWGEVPDDAGYVHGLAIDRAWAGRGLGRWLLHQAEQMAADAGKHYLRLDCVASNPALQRYYTEAGFTHRGDVVFPSGQMSLFEKRII